MGLGKRGDLWNSTERLWEHSPLKYLNQAVTPTLVIHSDEDYRCPLAEGYQVYSALQQRGVESRMVIFHGRTTSSPAAANPCTGVRRLRRSPAGSRSTGKESKAEARRSPGAPLV